MEHQLRQSVLVERPESRRIIEAELGFDKERVTVLHLLLPLAAALGFCWFMVFVERTEPLTWLAPLGLLLFVGAAYVQLRNSYRQAAGLVLGGALLALLLTMQISGNMLVAFGFGPLISAGMALLGSRWGWGMTVVASIAVLGLPAFATPEAASLRLSVLVVLWCGAWISWVTYRPLQTLMSWAWEYLRQVQSQIEELRNSRAELSRALASMDHAYYRIQQANYELERARQAAEEARRFKAEFAANVSHELRTPLNLILGFSEVIVLSPQSYDTPLPEVYRGDVEAIYRSARYLSSLVDDVLDLSGIEASRMALQLEPIDLRQIAAQAQATVNALFTDRGLVLRVCLPADLPSISGDSTRIRQVLINLLNNAARFTERGGVTIGASADEQAVTLSVTDSGIGIPADKLDRVFYEFEQLGAQTHRRYGGSGLGLAISKQFVELHGGRIWVESRVGEGSTFYVALPRDQQARFMLPLRSSTTSWASSNAQRLPEGPVLLVFDEDPWTARALQRYLDGYRVYPATLDTPAEIVPQAILVNVHAPPGPWPQLEQVSAVYPHTPVFMCALPTRRDEQHVLGADDYLLKPVSREQLFAAIERLMRPIQSVLVIDDDPEFVQLMTRMLGAAPQPYRVYKAEHGSAGLAQLRALRPDLVILDLLMPEMDGYTVLRTIRQDPALDTTPVIVVSARGYDQEVVRASMFGAVRGDGFSIGDLVAWLRASIGALQERE
ncbi:response regulator [Candidatus Gracilibacteria bacterium]|nr:response regulator [Candidatus Gracilibacteria bacterium]